MLVFVVWVLAHENAQKQRLEGKITTDLIFSKFTQLLRKIIYFPTLALFRPFEGKKGLKIGQRHVFSLLSPQNSIPRQKIYKIPDFQIGISKTYKVTAFARHVLNFLTPFRHLKSSILENFDVMEKNGVLISVQLGRIHRIHLLRFQKH